MTQNNKKFIFLLIFLAVIMFGLNFIDYSKNIKNFFFFLSSPIQKPLWRAGENLSNFFAGVLETKILKEELIKLYLKNQELFGRLVETIELKKENEALRKALNLGLEEEFQLIFTQVISKDVFEDSILINKGKRDGVLEGFPVITEEKILLGRIGQVYDNFSEVVLISNKKSTFDIKIITLEERQDNENDFNEVYGVAKGGGSFKLYFDLVSKEEEFFQEDLVITSVLGGVYPYGLLVGRIKTIKTSDVEAFQTGEIEPIFRVGNLDYLFIIVDF